VFVGPYPCVVSNHRSSESVVSVRRRALRADTHHTPRPATPHRRSAHGHPPFPAAALAPGPADPM
jgi:hypothetical protein